MQNHSFNYFARSNLKCGFLLAKYLLILLFFLFLVTSYYFRFIYFAYFSILYSFYIFIFLCFTFNIFETCLHMQMYIYIYICICICIYIYKYMYMYMYVYTCTCIYKIEILLFSSNVRHTDIFGSTGLKHFSHQILMRKMSTFISIPHI